ncbi:hypothetical protein [Peribacillus simplex]|uniref:hypothetical protein n=1 Tax=Peribacillus simplex TaxID=1478 RepID=UPI001E5D25EB|nr:hypothetical protein [Peribacillus simplex]
MGLWGVSFRKYISFINYCRKAKAFLYVPEEFLATFEGLAKRMSHILFMGEAQASVGGKSILPVVKAGGAVYNAKVKSQLDKEIDYVGSTGVEAKGEILKANAYAGIDNSSIGFGANAAVAEGEVSGIFPLPFTDYTIKGTAGASAFGAGGEAKIGKEIVLDLRLLIGIKLGLSFEKE